MENKDLTKEYLNKILDSAIYFKKGNFPDMPLYNQKSIIDAFNAGRDDFIEGAKWADEHPVKFWHKVADGDLPSEPQGDEFDMLFIVSTNDEDVLFAYYAHKEDEDAPEFYDDCELPLDVEYWAEIPKLPLNLHET